MSQAAVESEQVAAAAPAVASATPLGLFAFAITVFVLSVVNAGLVVPTSPVGANIIIGLALSLGGLVMLIVGIWEFRIGSTFTATVFCAYAAFWLSFGLLLLPATGILSSIVTAKGGGLTVLGAGIGLFLLAWTIHSALMFICVLRTNIAFIVTFGVLFLTLLALTIGYLGAGTGFIVIGGYLGILLGLVAWYVGLALLLPSINPSISLPLGPLA